MQELAKGPKLILRADDEQQLLGVLEAARAAGVPYHSIAEAAPGASSSGSGGGGGRGSSSGGGGAAGSGDAGAGSSSGGGAADVPRRARTILAFGPLPAEEIPKLAPGLVLL